MDQRLQQILIAMSAGEADEQDLRELSEQLAGDEAQCREYLEYCQLHGDLSYLIGSEDAEQRVLDQLGNQVLTPHSKGLQAKGSQAKGSQPTGAQSTSADTPNTGGPKPHGGGRLFGGRALGLFMVAASLAAVLAFTNWSSGPSEQADAEALRHPTIVATVLSADDAVWRQGEYNEGTSFRDGTDLQLQTGTVRVNLPSGVELVLHGPCDLSLDSPSQIHLRRGRVTARVAAWAPALTIGTRPLSVVSLGTHFAVEVNDRGTVEAHALEGNIRIEPVVSSDDSRRSFVVASGEAIRADSSYVTTERIPLNPERFAIELGEFRPYRSIPLHNSGTGLAVGDEDPNWRIVEGAIGAGFQGPQFAVVCEPDQRYLPNHPRLSQWMSVAKKLRPGCLPNSSYTFRTEFDLTGFDLSTVMVLADMLADNGVKAVRINGQPVELESWRDNAYLQKFHQFRRAEINSGFVAGLNTIEIDVWNGIYQVDPNGGDPELTPNPMSLRVEWQAFGIPTAAPALTPASSPATRETI